MRCLPSDVRVQSPRLRRLLGRDVVQGPETSGLMGLHKPPLGVVTSPEELRELFKYAASHNIV